MSRDLHWSDPDFLDWERGQVDEDPWYTWESHDLELRFTRYNHVSAGPMFCIKQDSHNTQPMRGNYSEVEGWDYGDVL